jgi:hypothetical protein
MVHLKENLIKFLSFPEALLESMYYDGKDTEIIILTDSAYLGVNGGSIIHNIKLKLNHWSNIEIRLYNNDSEKWESVDHQNPELLKDIYEFEISNADKIISISGFGKTTGKWTNWLIIDPKINIEYQQ